MSSRFALYIIMQKCTGKKMEDRSGRVIKDNPEVFLSDKRTTDVIAHGNEESCSPRLKPRYLIHIPYDLCTLTKYHG